MPINAGYEYFNAEKAYLAAQTLDEKILALEELIRAAPKHKSSENLLAELKTRLKKFREKSDKAKKTGRGKPGLKKEGYQVVLVGLPNSGKSSLLAALTNAKPLISSNPFVTRQPEIGTMDYEGVKAQIVDTPSIGSSFFDIGLVNTADCIVIVVEKLDDRDQVESILTRAHGKRILVLTKTDIFEQNELRKLEERSKSKRLNAIFVSSSNMI
jgi:small GTP-binding protein